MLRPVWLRLWSSRSRPIPSLCCTCSLHSLHRNCLCSLRRSRRRNCSCHRSWRHNRRRTCRTLHCLCHSSSQDSCLRSNRHSRLRRRRCNCRSNCNRRRRAQRSHLHNSRTPRCRLRSGKAQMPWQQRRREPERKRVTSSFENLLDETIFLNVRVRIRRVTGRHNRGLQLHMDRAATGDPVAYCIGPVR